MSCDEHQCWNTNSGNKISTQIQFHIDIKRNKRHENSVWTRGPKEESTIFLSNEESEYKWAWSKIRIESTMQNEHHNFLHWTKSNGKKNLSEELTSGIKNWIATKIIVWSASGGKIERNWKKQSLAYPFQVVHTVHTKSLKGLANNFSHPSIDETIQYVLEFSQHHWIV